MTDEIFDFDEFEPTRQIEVEEIPRELQGVWDDTNPDSYHTEIKGSQVSITHGEQNVNRTVTSTLVTPPENFSVVCGDIYRSSFPRTENFEFLSRLRLKSVICLIPEEYPEENRQFLEENGVQFFQIGMEGNKEPFVKIQPELISEAIKIVINPANHPILIHCNRGKHRTGCLVGCIRKLQKWSLSMIFDEYRKFAYPKERPLDQQFIEMFSDEETDKYAMARNWLPLKW